MEYKWDKDDLEEKYQKAVLLRKDVDAEGYKGMLEILNGELDFESINIAPNGIENETWKQRKDRYFDYMSGINDGLIEFAASVFSIAKTEDEIFTDIQEKELTLTDKELVDLGYEIIRTLNDKHALRVYREIFNKEFHHAHIMDFEKYFQGASQQLGGLTTNIHIEHKSYILILRNHTAEDVRVIVHEAMHAIINKLFKENRNGYYFSELEGRFGNRLTSDYLLTHNMVRAGNELTANELYSILNESYLLYLNNVLFATSKNSKFRFRDATNALRKYTRFKDSKISRSDLPYICTKNCFVTTMEILEYLMCLELATKYPGDPKEQYHKILYAKKHDSSNYLHLVLPVEYDFCNDRVKALRKLKKYVDKNMIEKEA